jgi:hypothetical protein
MKVKTLFASLIGAGIILCATCYADEPGTEGKTESYNRLKLKKLDKMVEKERRSDYRERLSLRKRLEAFWRKCF